MTFMNINIMDVLKTGADFYVTKLVCDKLNPSLPVIARKYNITAAILFESSTELN